MKIHAKTKCQCGHGAMSHTVGVFISGQEQATLEQVQNNSWGNGCSNCLHKTTVLSDHKFTLSNLDLIEYLAIERGLIKPLL